MKPINFTKRLISYHLNLWLIIAFIFSIGTFAPFCLEFIKLGFQDSLNGRLSTLLGSDLVISSRLPLPKVEIDKTIIGEVETKMVKSLYTMTKPSVAKNDEQVKSRLARLTFVPRGFPFYGKLIPDQYASSFFTEKVILVWPELLNILGLKVGDSLKIGIEDFKIIGEIQNDPGQVTQGQALAPRIYLGQQHEKGIGLISKGSTVSYSYYFKFSDNQQRIANEKVLKEKFDKEGIRVRNAKENGEFIGRTVKIINDFLGLGSFLSLILSMLAISFVLNKMFKREETSLKNFRQMGVPVKWVFWHYLKPFVVISFISSLLSSLVGYFLTPTFVVILKEKFNLDVQILSFGYVLLFTSISIISLIVLYFPITCQYLRNFYGGVLRQRVVQVGYGIGLVWITIVAFYWTNSWKLLGIVVAGTLALGLLISGCGYLFFKFLEKSISSQNFPIFKLGVLQMTRFKKHSLITIFLLTSSIGVFGLINSIAEGLENGLNYDLGDKRPEMFLFDIQPEQKADLIKLVEKHNGSVRKLAPMVRARLTKIDGEELRVEKDAIETNETRRKERFLKRGVNLSYQNKLFESEEIIEGVNFFDETASDKVSISVEEGYAKLLDLKVGSSMSFEVLGVEVQGEVRNIRKINWQSFDPNFFIVLSAGHLEDAPQTLVASLNLPDDKVAQFQNGLFDNLPNISSLDVRRVIQRIVDIISKVRGIFKIYGLFIILLGTVIIFGLLHLHWEDRSKDMAFFKLMGVKANSINSIMTIELILLFLFSIFFALTFQVLLSTIILYQIFEVRLLTYQSLIETAVLCLSLLFGLLIFYKLRNQRRNHRAFQIDV